MAASENDYWFLNKQVLEEMVARHLGFSVVMRRRASEFPDDGDEQCYQIMPTDPAGDVAKFWDRHLSRNKQWFSSPVEATLAFRAAWQEWVAEQAGEKPPLTRLQLIHELWAESQPGQRCPHVGHDDDGCFCKSPGLPEGLEHRRLPCDTASLQLWCLDDYRKCEIYREPRGSL